MHYHANNCQHTLTADFSRGFYRKDQYECTDAGMVTNLHPVYLTVREGNLHPVYLTVREGSQRSPRCSCEDSVLHGLRPHTSSPALTPLQLRPPLTFFSNDDLLQIGTQSFKYCGVRPVLRTDPVDDSNCRIHWQFRTLEPVDVPG
jgi:hypothetical protein